MSSAHDDKVAHLAMIQGVISRMGSNSFLLKGWNVTLVSALFALAAKDSNPRFIMIAFLPVMVFWALDAYYLRQERLFRKLYDEVVLSTDQTPLVPRFSMATAQHESAVESLPATMRSSTVFALHGSVIATVIVVLIILKIQ
jgi:hypothetical protein